MNPEVEKSLKLCPDLPSLSGVALRIVEMGRDPELDIGELAAVIGQDPALTSKILRIANSPLYSQRRRSENLRQAVMLLGLNATLTLALSFSLADSLQSGQGSNQLYDYVWRRALLAATAARLLGERCGLHSMEELFLAGLLQDIGVLALKAALPGRYTSVMLGTDTHDQLVAAEHNTLGCDHAEAGAWLMNQWGLPEYLAFAARASHDPVSASVPADMETFLHCVAASGPLADYCLNAEDAVAGANVTACTESWLGLDAEATQGVVEQLAETIPEIESLFEFSILAPAQIQAIKDQAREVMVTHNLRMVQEATESRREVAEYKRLHSELQERASRDPLTGLHNRGHLDQYLNNEFQQAATQGWPLSIGFIDLDHFKSINDSYGHHVGDTILTEVAQVLLDQVRGADTVVRYGGEEFVVVLPGTPLADATRVFERIRAALSGTGYAAEHGRGLAVTASVGVASLLDGGHAYEDADHLLRAADRALYLAKRGGRDRVEVAS